nr:14029_t:CDS:2 [Entrophospora candida]CAG8548273.1 10484_t:CDS:2 [Entrophospora candida]
MSSTTLEMAIDDQNNFNRRSRGRGQPRRSIRGSSSGRNNRFKNSPYDRQQQPHPPRGDVNGQWSHDLYEDGHNSGHNKANAPNLRNKNITNTTGNTRIIIENLFYEVTQEDLQELFSDCGIVKKAYLHYDRAGRSTGIAEITFENPKEADIAIRKYDGKTLDGQSMKIKYAPFKPPQRINSSRGNLDSGSVMNRLGGVSRGGQTKQSSRGNIRSRIGGGPSSNSSRGRVRVNNGSNYGGNNNNNFSENRRNPTNNRKSITYHDLDADLDAYMAIDEAQTSDKVNSTIINSENGMDLS